MRPTFETTDRKVVRVCEGDCTAHIGEVTPVHVVHTATGHDWGIFYYCDAAKEEDRQRGMRVEEI